MKHIWMLGALVPVLAFAQHGGDASPAATTAKLNEVFPYAKMDCQGWTLRGQSVAFTLDHGRATMKFGKLTDKSKFTAISSLKLTATEPAPKEWGHRALLRFVPADPGAVVFHSTIVVHEVDASGKGQAILDVGRQEHHLDCTFTK